MQTHDQHRKKLYLIYTSDRYRKTRLMPEFPNIGIATKHIFTISLRLFVGHVDRETRIRLFKFYFVIQFGFHKVVVKYTSTAALKPNSRHSNHQKANCTKMKKSKFKLLILMPFKMHANY